MGRRAVCAGRRRALELQHGAECVDRPRCRQAHRGALLYEQELGSLERFDLLLLGLGPDGHVASLYPEQPTLDAGDRRAIGAEAKLEPWVDRITLTLPMLRAADEVLFLVAGEDKADAAQRAFGGEPSPSTPGSLVRALGGKTVAVLDAAAASKLDA